MNGKERMVLEAMGAAMGEAQQVQQAEYAAQQAAPVECCGTCDAWHNGACTVNGPTPIALQQQRQNLMGQTEVSIVVQAMVPPMPEYDWCFKWTAKRNHVRMPRPQPNAAGGARLDGSPGNSR